MRDFFRLFTIISVTIIFFLSLVSLIEMNIREDKVISKSKYEQYINNEKNEEFDIRFCKELMLFKIGNEPTVDNIKLKNDSIYMEVVIDSLGDNIYFLPSKTLNFDEIFSLWLYINDDLTSNVIVAHMGNIFKSCNENNELIILFKDGRKILLKSTLGFNCDDWTYFTLSDDECEMLRKLVIDKVRLTNTRNFTSMTIDITDKESNYFRELYYAIDNNIWKMKE